MNLKNKTFLVTGGAKRIGAAIVRALAYEGANVIIHCNKSYTEALHLKKEIDPSGSRICIVSGDLASPDGADSVFDAALSSINNETIHGIINSASFFHTSTFDTLTHKDLINQMTLHLYSPMQLIRRMSKQKNVQSELSAVNIIDTRIFSTDRTHEAYLLSKQALYFLTRNLAMELAPHCRINAVAPGAVLQEEGQPHSELERLKAFNPLQSHGTPEECASCVLFLLKTDFITGQTIFYDGGYHLKTAQQ